MNRLRKYLSCALLVTAVACKSGGGGGGGAAPAASDGAVELLDPAGDDDGPGFYTYPTDPVYKRSSFDLTKLEVVPSGENIEFRVSVGTRIEDPWDSKAWGGNGFSVQMAFIHVDTDHRPSSGIVDGLPGTNVRFAAEEAWDKVVVVSPQPRTRVKSEIEAKALQWKDRIIVPQITRATGKTLIAVVPRAELGGAPQASWGYQVLMQSNEGFPAKTDLLTRKVNEYEGQHRFGGGTDYDNDPHVMDIFTSAAKGSAGEADAQHQILIKFDKNKTEPRPEDLVVVPMIYPGS